MNYHSTQLAGLFVVLLVNISILHGFSIRELKREMENEFQMLKRENSYDMNFQKRQNSQINNNGVGGENSILTIGIPKDFECQSYPNPSNGVIQCGGRLCLVRCHPGYAHGNGTAFVYRCNPESGEWTTLPVGKVFPWPDCREISRSWMWE